MENLKNVFVEALRGEIIKRRDNLLELDLNEGCFGKYYLGRDCDKVNNGVGWVYVRDEVIQNEELAYDDAKQELVEEMKNADYETFYSLIDDENVCNAIIKLLEGC
jgi:hypothetical protein|nr:MAG TPA: hypothetical protein [Caudoviricetes sp.]